MSNTAVDARFADPHSRDADVANERLHDRLAPMQRTHLCGDCGGELVLGRRPAGAELWPWALRCRTCGWRTEEEIYRRKSLIQRYKRGEALPVAIANQVEKRIGGRHMDSKALMATTEAGMMARIERAKFPQDLTPIEKKRLALGAITYGLDPLMGELTIYQGNLFVGIDGRRRKAQETGKMDGVHTRPATKQEKEDWGYAAEDYFFHADIYVKGATHPFEGWGRVSKKEIDRLIARANTKNHDPYSIPVVKDPQGMAEKRAEAKALRKAFNIPLPNAEEIGLEDEPLEFQAPTEINTQTGEIIDAECREVASGTDVPPEGTKATPASSSAESKAVAGVPQTSLSGEIRYYAAKLATAELPTEKYLADLCKTVGVATVDEIPADKAAAIVGAMKDRLKAMAKAK